MKEKLLITLMFIAMAIYMGTSLYQCHKQWKEGITVEQIRIEDCLIW